MRKKFIIKWMYWGNIFIGVGIVIGSEYIGLTVGNLFIGFEIVKE